MLEAKLSEDGTPITLGSSDIPVILGVHTPYRNRSIWDLWPRLVGLQPRYDDSDAAHLRVGRAAEDLLIPVLFREERGVDLVPGPKIGEGPPVAGPEPWMHARHDFTRSDNGGIVEAKKTRSWEGWGESGSDEAPQEYLVQVVWQQRIVAQQEAEIAAWCSMDDEFRIFIVPWIESYAKQIVDVVRNWYERHVLEFNPPPVDDTGSCGRNMSLVYPGGRAKIWRNPEPADLALAKDLYRVSRELSELDAKKKGIENRLRKFIDNDTGVRGVASWAPDKNGVRRFKLLYVPGALD